MTPLDRLLAKYDPLFKPAAFDEKALPEGMALHKTHKQLLQKRNGGYFYGGALHIFGACAEPEFHSLKAWNFEDTWRAPYADAAKGLFFFAEDAFGNQFAYDGTKVVRFDVEEGAVDELADDFDQWLLIAVEAPDELLHRPRVAAWAKAHGHLPHGKQLQAYPPFFLSDDADSVQLDDVDAIENMLFHASIVERIADQMAQLPEGHRMQISCDDEGLQITSVPAEELAAETPETPAT